MMKLFKDTESSTTLRFLGLLMLAGAIGLYAQTVTSDVGQKRDISGSTVAVTNTLSGVSVAVTNQQNVLVTNQLSLPTVTVNLPSGASTAALQQDNTNLLTAISAKFTVDGTSVIVSNIAPVTVSGVFTETNANVRLPLISQEATLQVATNLLTTINGKFTKDDNAIIVTNIAPVTVSGIFTETNANVRLPLIATEATLGTLVKDTNYNGRQALAQTSLDTIAGDTTSLDGKDFSTETTLATRASETNLSTRLALVATESTVGTLVKDTNFNTRIAALQTAIDTIAGDTTSLDGKDFATAANQLATSNRVAAVETLLQTLTNNVRGAYTPQIWLPDAGAAPSNVVKASPARLRYLFAINTNSAPIWIRAYNRTTAFTPGQDVGVVQQWMIPTQTNGFVIAFPGAGLNFNTGLVFTATGGRATNDATALPGAVDVSFGYE